MKLLLAILLTAVPLFSQAVPRPSGEFAIHMPDGSQKLLSSAKGKVTVLGFFFTTCSHCQDTCGVLNRIYPEYAAKGVQFMGAAFNDNAANLVTAFDQQFVKGYPVGFADRLAVYEFLKMSVMTPLYVPALVFIDRKGMIRSQHIGDPEFFGKTEENIRAAIDELLKEPAGKVVNRSSVRNPTKTK